MYKHLRLTTLTLSLTVVRVQTCSLYKYAPHDISNMQKEFWSGKVDVQAPQLIATALRIYSCSCTNILLGSVHCI